MLEKINSNAYRLQFPSHIRTANVFNVKHLIPFFYDSSEEDADCMSRSTFLSPGEDDAAAATALDYLENKDCSKVSVSNGRRRELDKQG